MQSSSLMHFNLLPIQLTRSSLTPDKLRMLELILQAIENKLSLNEHKEFSLLPNEESPLHKILAIVKTHLPQAMKIRKYSDYLLRLEIKTYFKRLEELKKVLAQWSNDLNFRLNVFQTTLPHHQDDEKKLTEIGGQFTALLNEIEQMNKEKAQLRPRIELRKATDLNYKISTLSLSLLINVHDLSLEDLTKNIEDYRKRTEYFNTSLLEIENKYQELKNEIKDFKKNFCAIIYILNCNSLFDASHQALFSSGYALGIYTIPKYIASPFRESPQKMNAKLNFSIHNLSEHQLEIIQNLINILCQKCEALEVESKLICQEAYLKPLQRLCYTWTPLINKKRLVKDALLITNAESLIDEIKNVGENFISLENKYIICIAQLSILYNQDERYADSLTYSSYSEDLERIAREKLRLDKELNQRIGLDVKNKISAAAFKIIFSSYDIIPEQLEENINSFHRKTKECKKIFQNLTNNFQLMNQKIQAFRETYDYFSYLYVNRLTNTTFNQLNFNIWYQAGYHRSLQKGKFKRPPEIVPISNCEPATSDLYSGIYTDDEETDNQYYEEQI